MKNLFFILIVMFITISCKKTNSNYSSQDSLQQTHEIDATNGDIKGSEASRENLDTVVVPLVETSPGIYETTQNFSGAHLTFNSLQIYGGLPYAKLISARAFGTPPGTNEYNIIIEGLNEEGSLQRSFSFQTVSCVGSVTKQKIYISAFDYAEASGSSGIYSFALYNDTHSPNAYTQWNLSEGDFLKLFEKNLVTTSYYYTRLSATFSNCSTVTLYAGKVIARRRPNTNNPIVYDYYVAAVGNSNEDRIFDDTPLPL